MLDNGVRIYFEPHLCKSVIRFYPVHSLVRKYNKIELCQVVTIPWQHRTAYYCVRVSFVIISIYIWYFYSSKKTWYPYIEKFKIYRVLKLSGSIYSEPEPIPLMVRTSHGASGAWDDVSYRMVTSSSLEVGWMATVSSNCALVAPILMATEKPCNISSQPWPSMCRPITWSRV